MYVCHVCYDVCGVCGEHKQVGHGARGGPFEGEREEGEKTTLTQYPLIMQQLITHDRNDPAASLSCLRHTYFSGTSKVTFVQKIHSSFRHVFYTYWSISFMNMILCAPARTLGTFEVCAVEIFSRQLF